MRFLTLENVSGQIQVRCQVTQATMQFQQGVIESRMNAENALATSQHNAIEAMKAVGLLTEESAKDLDAVQKAYVNFVSQGSNHLENTVDELGRQSVRCLVTGRLYLNGEAVAEQNQLFASLRAQGYLAPGVTDLAGLKAAFSNYKKA